jgi:hypothetical protein
MTYYALAMGGSGSRCAEALIYLSAAGLGPPGKLTLLFVDPDRANYSLDRVLRVAGYYRELQAIRRGANCSLFGTEIALTEPKSWTPFATGAVSPSLANFFEYDTMRQRKPQDAALFEMLYTPEQRRAILDIGFRGRPSIGAAVFGAKIDLSTEEPWRSVAANIASESANSVTKIFSFGSLFGGTGAAGLPTVPRLLCLRKNPQTQKFDQPNPNVHAGASLLLPYFAFTPSAGMDNAQVYANCDAFLLNAKEALRYYAACNPMFKRMYVLGSEALAMQANFSIGGKDQNNKPSYVEFLAALATRDFYGADLSKLESCEVGILGRHAAGEFGWADVPDGAVVARKLGQFTRTAFAFVKLFTPYFDELRTTSRRWYLDRPRRRAWYQDLMERRGVDPAEMTQALKSHLSFFTSYLGWLRDLHWANGTGGGFRVNLADAAAFLTPEAGASLVDEKFGRLMGEQQQNPDKLEDVLRRLAACDPGSYSDAAGLGYFQHALYDACGYPQKGRTT